MVQVIQHEPKQHNSLVLNKTNSSYRDDFEVIV